ncbi:hypothetical protein ACH33_07685 [Aneurinibacillus sp. XH2]|uniref:hypothetical protein n=1 Tax=Aneurinibacillus sp. XH2 TaxID=1450761 RepID=UPI00070C4D09|nr:hypothetical protein [Aneurinibacillus sp. XH2]AMA72744.1 hypothetical protein ACH33_07685 [Aneurinibacillus sp. XH2]
MMKFHCHRCEETFRIEFQNLYNKVFIQCPNCALEFPPDAVKALRQFSEAYMDTVDILKKTGSFKECWSISLEGNSTPLPGPINEFEHVSFGYEKEKEQSYWQHRRKPYEAKIQNIDDGEFLL